MRDTFNCRGYSLLECLIVSAIIANVATWTVLEVRYALRTQKLQQLAEEIHLVLNNMGSAALVTGKDYQLQLLTPENSLISAPPIGQGRIELPSWIELRYHFANGNCIAHPSGAAAPGHITLSYRTFSCKITQSLRGRRNLECGS